MQYIQYIESSATWTCPKTGKWKVICVGGGSSGNCSRGGNTYSGHTGEVSSFGTYLTAKGGNYLSDSSTSASALSNGALNGFTGNNNNYGTIIPAYVGLGYGAASQSSFSNIGGFPGEIKTTIIDLKENESIPCTIGKGGAIPEYYNSGNPMKSGYAAKDGVIVVQYLGE